MGDITRREFVEYGVLSGAAISLASCKSVPCRVSGGTSHLSAGDARVRLIAESGSIPAAWRVHALRLPRLLRHQVDRNPSAIIVERPADGLILEINFDNVISIRSRDDWRLQPASPGSPVRVVARLPPQHLLERALEFSNSLRARRGLVTKMSGPSRIAFKIPPIEFHEGFEASIERLLDWEGWETLVQQHSDSPAAPTEFQTSIELPYRLLITPSSETTSWRQSRAPRPIQGVQTNWNELWHVSAESRSADSTRSASSDIRVIWTKDNNEDCSNSLAEDSIFNSVPNRKDRKDLVDHHRDPIPTTDLTLTPLGGTIKLEQYWDELDECAEIDGWRQHTVMGRDQDALISHSGYIMPFGNRVSWIKQNVRLFEGEIPQGGTTGTETGFHDARLVHVQYCVVREATRDLRTPDNPYPNMGFDHCYRLVTIQPERTPPLVNRCEKKLDDRYWMSWMAYAENPSKLFEFDVIATDHDGNTEQFKLPLFWVSRILAENTNCDGVPFGLDDALDTYLGNRMLPECNGHRDPADSVLLAAMKEQNKRRRTGFIGGKQVAYVPRDPGVSAVGKRDGSLETIEIEFGVASRESRGVPVPEGTAGEIAFAPTCASANVRLNTVSAFAPSGVGTGQVIRYNSVFTARGFDDAPPPAEIEETRNLGHVFADVYHEEGFNKPRLLFASERGGERSGGIASPSINVAALSRRLGPVGGESPDLETGQTSVDVSVRGGFDAGEFFAAIDGAQLLGVIDLAKAIRPIAEAYKELGRYPKLLAERIKQVNNFFKEHREFYDLAKQAVDLISALRDGKLMALAEDARRAIEAEVQLQLGAIEDARWRTVMNDPDLITLHRRLHEVLEEAEHWEDWAAKHADSYLRSAEAWALKKLSAAANAAQRPIRDAAWSAIQTAGDVVAIAIEIDQAQRRVVDALKHYESLPHRLVEELVAPIVEVVEAIDQTAEDPVGAIRGLRDAAKNIADVKTMRWIENQLNSATIEIARVQQINTEAFARSRKCLDEAQERIKSELDKLRQGPEAKYERIIDQYQTLISNQILRVQAEVRDLQQMMDDRLRVLLDDVAESVEQALAGVIHAIDIQLAEILEPIDEAIRFYESIRASIPEAVEISYDWEPGLQDAPSSRPIFIASSAQGVPARMRVSTRARQNISFSRASSPPHTQINASITDCRLCLIPAVEFVTVGFKRVEFKSENGGRPSIHAELDSVEFGSVLGFIATLAKLFGEDSAPEIEMIGGGVRIGYGYPFPSIRTGGFNLFDLSISSQLTLPFNGDPVKLKLVVSERDAPFILSYGVWGGGGFAAIELSARKIESVEISLEYGAVVSLSIPLASGTVSVRGGIYFSRSGELVILTGFIRIVGQLSVLGLIQINAMFYLGLSYLKRGDESFVVGEALIQVGIKIGFFSIKVEVRCRREVKGSSRQEGVPSRFAETIGEIKSLPAGEANGFEGICTVSRERRPGMPRSDNRAEASRIWREFADRLDWSHVGNGA